MTRTTAVSLTCRIHWRLRMLMAERDIADATALYARLKPLGYAHSVSQLRRLVGAQPASIRFEFLAMLCQVFDVSPAELLLRVPGRANEKPHGVAISEDSRRNHEQAEEERLLGPPMPALPKGKYRAR